MKNHFIFAYAGNKREEVERIYKELDFKDITTIIEPYCGTSAMSFYIASKNPKKYKYILNDTDENLIQLYKMMRDEEQTKLFYIAINEIIKKFNECKTEDERKIYYLTIINKHNLYSYFFTHKYYGFRIGLCPLFDRIKQIQPFDLSKIPIYAFLNTEDITFSNIDAIDVVKNYKNDKCNLLLMDPPYIATCNSFYANTDMNIYEWLYKNNINTFQAEVVLILENIWINKLLFQSNNVSEPYSKNYQFSKKKTTHIIIKKSIV
jgi:site-specific DNA-adenine methylase